MSAVIYRVTGYAIVKKKQKWTLEVNRGDNK